MSPSNIPPWEEEPGISVPEPVAPSISKDPKDEHPDQPSEVDLPPLAPADLEQLSKTETGDEYLVNDNHEFFVLRAADKDRKAEPIGLVPMMIAHGWLIGAANVLVNDLQCTLPGAIYGHIERGSHLTWKNDKGDVRYQELRGDVQVVSGSCPSIRIFSERLNDGGLRLKLQVTVQHHFLNAAIENVRRHQPLGKKGLMEIVANEIKLADAALAGVLQDVRIMTKSIA